MGLGLRVWLGGIVTPSGFSVYAGVGATLRSCGLEFRARRAQSPERLASFPSFYGDNSRSKATSAPELQASRCARFLCSLVLLGSNLVSRAECKGRRIAVHRRATCRLTGRPTPPAPCRPHKRRMMTAPEETFELQAACC